MLLIGVASVRASVGMPAVRALLSPGRAGSEGTRGPGVRWEALAEDRGLVGAVQGGWEERAEVSADGWGPGEGGPGGLRRALRAVDAETRGI